MEMRSVTTGLGPHIMAPLVEYWKELRKEHYHLTRQIHETHSRLQKFDKQIGISREKNGLKAKTTSSKIERRKLVQRKELEALEWHLHSVDRSLRTFDKPLTEAIDNYARTSCYTLTSSFYNALPRELRDMVYDYVLSDDDIECIGNRVRWQVEQNFDSSTQGLGPLAFDMPHFLDAWFAPPAVSNEVLESAARQYSRSQVRPILLGHGNLEIFGEMQALGMGVSVSHFFRDIKAMIWVNKLFAEWKTNNQRRVNDIAAPDWIEHIRDVVFSIPVRPDRKMTTVLELKDVNAMDAAVFVQAIKPVFEEVGTRGFLRTEYIMWSQETTKERRNSAV